MKQKKNETIPVGLLIGLLFLCTAVAGGLAFLAKGDLLKLPAISFDMVKEEQEIEPSILPQEEPAEDALEHTNPECQLVINTL